MQTMVQNFLDTGVMYEVGALGMLVCAVMRRKRYHLNVLQCIIYAMLLTVCGVVGAKLLSFLESGMTSWGGVSFYGMMFLCPMVMTIVAFMFGLKPSEIHDLGAPCGSIMMVFVRIGCWLDGCCGGWVMYIGDIYFAWPTQIMECIADLLIAIWLLRVEAGEKWKGLLCPLWMLSYSIMRFLLEFLRYTPEKWLNLGHGQWFAIAAIIISVVWIKIYKRNLSVNLNEQKLR